MTKYNINYRKVDKEQEEQQSCFKDLAHKCSRSKSSVLNGISYLWVFWSGLLLIWFKTQNTLRFANRFSAAAAVFKSITRTFLIGRSIIKGTPMAILSSDWSRTLFPALLQKN